MITTALRSFWAEPHATGAPERVWRDWALVGAIAVTALLEGVLRTDVTWRPFITIVTVGLALQRLAIAPPGVRWQDG